MLRSSIPFGRLFGVEVRIHLSLLVLLALSVVYASVAFNSPQRGAGLWLTLAFAIVVREFARALAAMYSGLQLRAVFLLPVGGVMAFAPREPGAAPASTRLMSIAATIANFGMGLLLMGLCYGLEPSVSLLAQPWVSFGHLLRSMVWIQMVVGAVNLLPMSAIPSRHVVRPRSTKAVPTLRGAGSGFGLGAATAVALILAGFVLTSLWLIILGGFMLLYAQVRAGAPLDVMETGAIHVSDVMLTEYTLLSSSDTLRGALERAAHSLQDVFPVVRGDRLVGAISRDTLAAKLQMEGDGYLQAAMTRDLPLAAPGEKLVEALRRGSALGASDFIPVVDSGAMLGILTPQSLTHAVQQVRLTRPPREEPKEP